MADVFTAPDLLAYLFWRDGPAISELARVRGLALWAMTLVPIATVAALRETSVLFGVAIAVFVLGETGDARRLVAAVLVVAGAATLRLI